MLLARQIAAFAEGRTRDTPRNAAGMRPAHAGLAAAAGALLAVVALPGGFTCVRLDGPWMPERDAAEWIDQNHLHGRLLTWFDWGQYAIWHFAPDLQVSLDGRRETVYSPDYLARHTELYFDPDAHADFLRALNPDYAWLARDLPLVAALDAQGWHRLFTGPTSVVLSRAPVAAAAPPPLSSRPCFPGP
jgi:hypothetical protein